MLAEHICAGQYDFKGAVGINLRAMPSFWYWQTPHREIATAQRQTGRIDNPPYDGRIFFLTMMSFLNSHIRYKSNALPHARRILAV